MNLLAIKNNKFFAYINNFSSVSLGFYFSLIFHFIILLFAVGLPNFFEKPPIYVPNVIPIEILNVTDTTSIPKELNQIKEKKNFETPQKKFDQTKNKTTKESPEVKKFNKSDNKEITKLNLKEKPNINTKENDRIESIKENITINEKQNSPIKIEEKTKILPNELVESLPTNKIKPKIKPKPKINNVDDKNISDVVIQNKPKPKPRPEFNIASMLKDLRNESSSQVDKKKLEKKKRDDIDEQTSNMSSEENKATILSISEIDNLRQQLRGCWIRHPGEKQIEFAWWIKIKAKINPNRTVQDGSIQIFDTNIPKSNQYYMALTENAKRTLKHPKCSVLDLPEKKYKSWKEFSIVFDQRFFKN